MANKNSHGRYECTMHVKDIISNMFKEEGCFNKIFSERDVCLKKVREESLSKTKK